MTESRRSDGEPLAALSRLVSLLVDAPREVRLNARRHRDSSQFQAWVAEGDLGKLIGRQGRTARALRTLLDVRGERDDHRYGLDIRD